MKQIPIALPEDLREYLERISKLSHESIASYVRRLIVEDKKRGEECK